MSVGVQTEIAPRDLLEALRLLARLVAHAPQHPNGSLSEEAPHTGRAVLCPRLSEERILAPLKAALNPHLTGLRRRVLHCEGICTLL